MRSTQTPPSPPRRGRCSIRNWSRKGRKPITASLLRNIINSWESFTGSWWSCGSRWRSFWGMKATPRWPTSICCGWATPARTSGSSGRSSSRRLRRSTAPTSRTFTAVPKTARSRAWSICWGTRRPARREAGSRPCRVWRRSTTGCRSRRRGNCRCRPATAIPICSPTR